MLRFVGSGALIVMRAEMRILVPVGCIAVAVLTCPVPTTAQIVRGAVVAEATNAPIQGVFLSLLDEQGSRRAAVLTDSAGAFVIEAPGAGPYRLRAERIGYARVTSEVLLLKTGETFSYRLAVPIQAIELEGLTVGGEGRCQLSSEVGTRTSVLWEEGRKALDVVAWMEGEGGRPYQATLYERARNLLNLEILENHRHLRSGFGRTPFRSRPAAELSERGYIQDVGNGFYEYFGPDADVLLSDDFLSKHCFHIRNAKEGRIGLAFAPIGTAGPPDIEGTLWFRSATLELVQLDFTYTRHLYPVAVPKEPFGGQVDFHRLVNGAWVVRSWWIRMPQFVGPIRAAEGAVRMGSPARSSRDAISEAARRGMRIREEGGWLVTVADAPRPAPERGVQIVGTVLDSVGPRSVSGATVFLLGERNVVRADGLGGFRMRGVSPGEHQLAFFNELTDSLLLAASPHTVNAIADRTTPVVLSIKPGQACAVRQSTAGMVGYVDGAFSGEPLRGRTVRVSWKGGVTSGRGLAGAQREAETTTDGYGRYLLCDIPVGATVHVSTEGSDADVQVVGTGVSHYDMIGSEGRR